MCALNVNLSVRDGKSFTNEFQNDLRSGPPQQGNEWLYFEFEQEKAVVFDDGTKLVTVHDPIGEN